MCNFLEAVSSGKKFKDINTGIWYFIGKNTGALCKGYGVGVELNIISQELILSEFEIEEKIISLKESDFDRVFKGLFISQSEFLKFKKEVGF